MDDNKVIRQLIRVNLELEGLEVVTAADGAECLDVVHEVRPDVVTLDVVMPRLDGLRTAARLRADPRTHHLPLAIISACSQYEVETGLDVGVDAFLAKPFEPAELVRLVMQLMERRIGPESHGEHEGSGGVGGSGRDGGGGGRGDGGRDPRGGGPGPAGPGGYGTGGYGTGGYGPGAGGPGGGGPCQGGPGSGGPGDGDGDGGGDGVTPSHAAALDHAASLRDTAHTASPGHAATVDHAAPLNPGTTLDHATPTPEPTSGPSPSPSDGLPRRMPFGG